jgi:pre-rRNA-processing protein TSR4
MSESSWSIHLGFSEPLVEQRDKDLVAHKSPIWNDWDGGQIGGKPCWINPRDIPNEPLRCSVCARRNKNNTKDQHQTYSTSTSEAKSQSSDNNQNKGDSNNQGTILRFLTQIYCPVDKKTKNDASFHRSFYVFGCPDPICSSTEEGVRDSVVVLRGQMAQKNEFYPYDCDDDDVDIESWKLHKSENWEVNLCAVCGQKAKGKCPLSNKYFCSKEHQREYHKLLRESKSKKSEIEDDVFLSSLVYAESELVVEEEPKEDKKTTEDDEKKLAGKINKDSLFADTDDVDDDGADDGLLEQSDLNQMTGMDMIGGTSDQATMDFYTRIGRAGGDVKGQCLRYSCWPDHPDIENNDDDGYNVELDNGALWISSSNRPNVRKDIPACEYCGAERKFEFQLMPQMIHMLTKLRTSTSDTDENGEIKSSEDIDFSEDGQNALLAASDIIDKAKEEGKEDDLPADFKKTQEALVEKLKRKVLDGGNNSGDNIDFGVISVYTCTKSCGDGRKNEGDESYLGAYRKEFAWRQPPLI